MITLKKIATGQDMITQLAVYQIVIVLIAIIAIGLCKQQALDDDPKSKTTNQFYKKSNSRKKCKYNNVFHFLEVKGTILDFS